MRVAAGECSGTAAGASAALAVEGEASTSAAADCSLAFSTFTKVTGANPEYRAGSFAAAACAVACRWALAADCVLAAGGRAAATGGWAASGRCSAMAGCWSALASAKLVPASGRISDRSAMEIDLVTDASGVAACCVALCGASCDGDEPKYITPAAITNGGSKSTQALTPSWAQMSPRLRLVGPLRTIVIPPRLRSAEPPPAAANRSHNVMPRMRPCKGNLGAKASH